MPNNSLKISLGRRYYFSAIHTIPQESFIHGHDYALDVQVSGPLQEETGWISSREELDSLIKESFLDRIDRSWVNKAVLPATGENLARIAHEQISNALPKELKLTHLEIHETRKNSFTALSR